MEKRNVHILQSLSYVFFAFIVFAIYLILPSGITAQGISSATVIKNVCIFDGEKIIPLGMVVFENGKITAVCETDECSVV